jgi:ParB family transcriptional regulator, chromosome partitioning protein
METVMPSTATVTAPPRLIAVAKLKESPQNVRRTATREALEELKASILALGLMQNLVVTAAPRGTYRVTAGGRRLAALRELQKEGKLPADYAVPCQVVADDQALEMSLAENTVRLAMHPADEFEAFSRLAETGNTAEQIAIRFGVTARHVEQRMKLGRLAPELLAHYRAGDLTLESLMAFTVTDDRGRQIKVYESLQGWNKNNPRQIRGALTDGLIEAESRLATFVGLETYGAAGGTTRTDLFGDAVYLENPDLLFALVSEKLKLIEQGLKDEGWAWVDVSSEWDWSAIAGFGRINPQPTNAPKELLDLKAQVEGELQEIQHMQEDTESDASIDALDQAEARLAEVEEKLASHATYDAEEKRIAGCYAAIDHDGELRIERGLVRRGDLKHLATADPSQEPKPKGMSEPLRRDLEAYRLQIAQAEIARHPAIAFDLLVFHVACRVFDHVHSLDGPDVHFRESHPRPGAGTETVAAERLNNHQEALPVDWLRQETEAARFNAFRAVPDDEKHRILAYCMALTLKPKLAPAEGGRATAYDVGLQLTGASVNEYWRPTSDNYLSRVTRDQLLSIGREVLGEQWVNARRKDKKGELVNQLDRAFAAPDRDGRTPEQAERLERWLPAGMEFGGTGAMEIAIAA